MLPEMQKGRRAESTQAGRENLQTQTLTVAGARTRVERFEILSQREPQTAGWLCVTESSHQKPEEERSPGHGAPSPPETSELQQGCSRLLLSPTEASQRRGLFI